MISLGVDTCDARGSVALCRDGVPPSLRKHDTREEYSAWLLPAVQECLQETGIGLGELGLLCVATGPGSFTGLRVGLTAVKAWAELFQIPIVGVSRLEVLAREAGPSSGYTAASFDAQRGQIFGGLYSKEENGDWRRTGEEIVTAPGDFVRWVDAAAGRFPVRWVTPDPHLFLDTPCWSKRLERGDTLIHGETALAAGLAALGEKRARVGEVTDALHLDANYVRRSDAEIFWKDPVSRER